MNLHLTPHNLSVEAMARRDAQDAHHGHAVSNPYPKSHPDHEVWQWAFNSRLLELGYQQLLEMTDECNRA